MSNEPRTFADVSYDLRKPLPPEAIQKVNKGGRGTLDTINHAYVTDVLNRTAPEWTYEIVEITTTRGAMIPTGERKNGRDVMRFQIDPDGLPHVLAVYGWFQVGGVRRWEVGEVENVSTYGDELKKAISDFIKRGAMRFGVGVELWAKGALPGEEAPEDADAEPSVADPILAAALEDADAVVATDDGVYVARGIAGDNGSGGSGDDRASAERPAGTDDGPRPSGAGPSVTSADTGPADVPEQVGLDGPGPGDPGAASGETPAGDLPADDELWARLDFVAGSRTQAVNRLNKTNRTAYTTATAAFATRDEVLAAISGGAG